MASFKLEQFGGQLPAWDDHLLPASQAALSENAYLFSGALTGWRKPKDLRDLNLTTSKFAYRVPTITSATATAQLVFHSNPVEGDTFKIGEFTYKFTATVTAAFDILIGATSDDTANNALACIVVGVGVGTIYGTGSCPNPELSVVDGANHKDVAAGEPIIYLLAADEGEAFNAIVVQSSNLTRFDFLDVDLNASVTTFQGGLNKTFDNNITGSGVWLEYADQDTAVMRSAVVDDKFQRYYISSPSQPPKYNTYDRIQAGSPEWLLGLNPPGCAPGVSVTGGGNARQMGFPTSITTDTEGLPGNSITLVQITPTEAMSLNDVALMPAETSETARFAAVLYDDQAGVPFQLIAFGDVVTGCTVDEQITSPFTNPPPLLAGVKYWIGMMTDLVISVHAKDTSSAVAVSFSDTFNNGPPLFGPLSPTTGVRTPQLWADLTTSSILAARSYVYTWVSEYGEESPPSPYTLVNGWSNGVWDITLWVPPADDMGVLRNIKTVRIYRTQVANTGQATYVFVAEVPVGTLDYQDIIPDNIVALNRQMPSATWFPPPEGLSSIMSMPNGMAVGFRGNEVWFCEPYQPHAWPATYVVTTEFPIVGLGTTGQSVVIATAGKPYVATGVTPGQMSLQKCDIAEPCISRGSIISNDDGVYYISPNGLVLVTQYGKVTNTTDLWITREKWRQLTPGKNVRAIMVASSYFCFGTTNGSDNSVAQQGFVLELSPADAQSFTIWPQPGGHRIGFSKLTAPYSADIDNVLVDPWTGIGYILSNFDGLERIQYYDFGDTAPNIMPYKWRTKIYQQGSVKNFEVMRFYFTIPPNTPDQNVTRNEDATDATSWNVLEDGQYGIVRVYAVNGSGDTVLVTTRELRQSGEVLRILSGFKAEEWSFEIEARVKISNMQVATTLKELGQV